MLIVGAGAAASVIAAKAARKGKSVIMLEAGPARSLQDLASSQIQARKLKWGGPEVEETGNHKVGNNFNTGWGTGGAAMHHYAVWPRLHEVDFKQRTQFGIGNDWPFEYDDLRPFYDRIQTEVGLSGDSEKEIWRPKGAAYPMPALPVFAQGNVIAKGFEALGRVTAPIPMAINSQLHKKRSACIYDGWCDAGCPTGALLNPLVHYLPNAIRDGAQIINNAMVSKVLTAKNGAQVTGVEYYDVNGELNTQFADIVVLAANTVQNPRLLLASANAKHPAGLVNKNDLVGRYLMSHPAKTVNGLFSEKTLPHLGVTGGQLINQDNYDDKLAVENGFGGYQWLIANAVKPNDLLGFANSRPDIRGKALQRFMQKAAQHYGTMVYVADDIPDENNRVRLSTKKDSFGIPLANTTHDIQAKTKALISDADADGLAIFKHAGANEAWLGPLVSMHIMGGTIMGNSAADSVCNEFGQTHEIENLFIAGSGLFPSSGAVNPTFTLHALALKTSDYILANFS